MVRGAALVCGMMLGAASAASAETSTGDLDHLTLYICPYERIAGMFPVVEAPDSEPRLVGGWGDTEITRFDDGLRIVLYSDIIVINDDLNYVRVEKGRVTEGRCYEGLLQFGYIALGIMELVPAAAQVAQNRLDQERMERADSALIAAGTEIARQSRQIEQLRNQVATQAELIRTLREKTP